MDSQMRQGWGDGASRSFAQTIAAIARGRCPRCRRGAIFDGLWRTNEKCGSCGLLFDRGESGYFAGAMYISYAMAIPIALVTSLSLSYALPAWSFERVVGTAFVLLLPLSPVLFRYSRILWVYFDRAVDP